MPAYDGSWCNRAERLFPPIPSSTQQEPEELLTSGESAARSLSMQGEPMLAEDDILEDQIPGGSGRR